MACEYCQTEQAKITRHLGTCIVYKLVTNKNDQFIKILKQHQLFHNDEDIQKLVEENEKLKTENEDLKIKLQHKTGDVIMVENKVAGFINNNFPGMEVIQKPTDPVKLLTRKRFPEKDIQFKKKIWEHYKTYCAGTINDYQDVDSGNNFIKSLPQNTSLSKKKAALERMMTLANNDEVELKRLINIKPKEKFCFKKPDDMYEYLIEQSKLDYDYYVMQTFLAKFGLRVHTIAELRWEHLKNLDTNFIKLPDKKDKKVYTALISIEFKHFLKKFISRMDQSDKDGFIFLPNNKVISSRKSIIKQSIKRKLLSSDIIKKTFDDSLTYSSHCIRKTTCFLNYEDGYRELVKKCGGIIGHEIGSRATKTYISVTNKDLKPEFAAPLIFRNGDEVIPAKEYPNCPNCNKALECECMKNDVEKIKTLLKTNEFGVEKEIVSFKFKILLPTTDQWRILRDSLYEATSKQNIEFTDELIFDTVSSYEIKEDIQELSEANIKTWKEFKGHTRMQGYGPYKVISDKEIGFYVMTTADIKFGTLISEYVGEIIPYHPGLKSDTLFEFTGDLVITCEKYGNLAKYISGINNKKSRKGNVSSLKVIIENEIHIILYACKNIDKGEMLKYDYNAGKLKEYVTDKFV